MSVTLTAAECRVLGTLVEKAFTVPSQYPITLNGLVAGCNQRSNRDPVVEYGEETVLDALDGLRAKGLAREVSMEGSRVAKYRHVARDGLGIGAPELAILAELLLRGPQTVGELRSRASRMHPMESLDVVEAVLESLRDREAPLIERIAPAPGSRADRFAQLLCPNLHGDESVRISPVVAMPTSPSPEPTLAPDALTGITGMMDRIAALEAEVTRLRQRLDHLERELGAG